MTQRTIAAKLDLTPQTVNSYAIGKVEPGLSVMLKFAEACGYHLVDFLALGREEE